MMNKDQLIEWGKSDSREKRLLQYVADYHLFKRIFVVNISNEDMVKIFIEYVDSMWGEEFHGKYLQVTVIPEVMESDHMFVDDILYVHGLNSNGGSRTATELKRLLKDEAIVFSPDFSNDLESFREMKKNIDNMIVQKDIKIT